MCVCVYNSVCKCVFMACAAGGLGGIGMGLGPGGQPINANRLSGGGVGSMGPGGVFTFVCLIIHANVVFHALFFLKHAV